MQAQAQHARRGLGPVKPGCMTKVEQPLHWRHVPAQAPGQFSFLDALIGHAAEQAQPGPFKRCRAYRALAPFGFAGQWQRHPGFGGGQQVAPRPYQSRSLARSRAMDWLCS